VWPFRRRSDLARAFEQYLSPEALARLEASPGPALTQLEPADITFAIIQLRDDDSHALNYVEQAATIAQHHEGMVETIMGSCLLVTFDFPKAPGNVGDRISNAVQDIRKQLGANAKAVYGTRPGVRGNLVAGMVA
jgi:hypothetical protein